MLEILAPVGNIQALKAAIYSGADAVYLGLDLFNARIKADNFNKDNIAEWVRYCHLFNVKVYVTFNTNIKSSEKEIFAEYVDIAAKANVDAFIVTDLGCLDIFRKYDIPLHGSTQIGVHNLAGAKVLEKLGFIRVVLARETLNCDIRQIKQNTKLEIEHFVHGALCVSFSGSCLMSSMMSGDSGNRGRCNQPCRLKYKSSITSKYGYLLSPKDQCLIAKVGELAEMGVDSLKIEGRLKQPHYVGEAVSQYRIAVDNLSNKKEKINYDALKTAYNRGNFTLGYNYDNSQNIMYDKINGNLGLKVGSLIACSRNKLTLDLDRELFDGDGVKIINNNQELGGFAIEEIKKVGKYYEVRGNYNFPAGSSIHLTLDSRQVNKYEDIFPKLSIKFYFIAKLGARAKLIAEYEDIRVEAEGDTVQKGLSQFADIQSISKHLLRLGGSNFSADIEVDIDENIFIAGSMLNNMRRSVIEKLENAILSKYDSNKQRVEYSDAKEVNLCCKNPQKNNLLYVETDLSNKILEIVKVFGKKINLVLNFQQDKTNISTIITEINLIKKYVEKIYLKLPRIARGTDYNIIEDFLVDNKGNFDGIVADNLYGVYLAKKFNMELIGGIGLNVYNEGYAKVLGLDGYINSVELTNLERCGGMTYAYGKLPIMTLLHCPIQVNSGCDCASCNYKGSFYYYDKRGSYLIERIKLSHCQFILYNQQNIDIRSKISRVLGNYYLNLCGCDSDKIPQIIEDFMNKSGESDPNSTYGHLFRGVK